MLAIFTMSPGFQAFFFCLAVLLLVLAAFRVETKVITLFPLGVALFVLVFAYNAIGAIH